MTAEIKEVKISELTQSEYNYREELGNVRALSTNIEGVGMYDEPLVRPTQNGSEAKYEVIDGIHRIAAAKENGEETVEVRVKEVSDLQASRIAISTDIEELKNWRGIKERTKALISHWRLMGGEGEPNATKLANELDVPRSTIRRWLETARNEWKGTPIHAEFDNKQTGGRRAHLSINVDDVGETTLQEIRRTVKKANEDIKNKGVKLAKEVEKGELDRSDIREIKKLVDEEGKSLDEAQAEVMFEEEEEQETEKQTESEDEIPDGWDTEPEQEQTQNDTKSAKPEQKQSDPQSMEPQVQNPDLDLGGATIEDIRESRGIDPEEYAKAAMEQEKENIEAMQDSEVQENIAIFENHGAHKIIMTVIGNLRCPVCGGGPECLQWSCGDHESISVKEATDMTEDILKDNVGGE